MSYALGLEKKPWEEWFRYTKSTDDDDDDDDDDDIHDNQIGVGEGRQRQWTATITTTTTGRAGIRAYWGCLLIVLGDD